jgi:hypothetical protein
MTAMTGLPDWQYKLRNNGFILVYNNLFNTWGQTTIRKSGQKIIHELTTLCHSAIPQQ